MRPKKGDSGVTLVETMLAVVLAFIVMSAIGGVVFSALVANKNQGIETSRMTVIAQEKMNELTRLPYYKASGYPTPTCPSPLTLVGSACVDTTTNTTLISDAGWAIGLSSNANTDLNYLTACPSAGSPDEGYVDFLDQNGIPLAGTCSSVITQSYAYERRWQVTDVTGTTGLKQLNVVVYDLSVVKTNPNAAPPYVTLTTFKSE